MSVHGFGGTRSTVRSIFISMRFKSHKSLDAPHGNLIAWRYLGLDKLLDLLTNARLFFVNAQKLTDAYEVSMPDAVQSAKRKELEKAGMSGRDLEEELAAFSHQHSPMRDLTLVNCWSLGRQESYALWKIYLGGAKYGAAIRTSVSHLRKAIESGKDPYPEDVYIGRVTYTDFVASAGLTRFRLITRSFTSSKGSFGSSYCITLDQRAG